MGSRRLSTRVMFYVVSIITLVLLLGSTALQRVVFKADQITSAVFLTPGSISLKPGAVSSVRLQATFAGTATVAAAQFSLSFDPAVVEVVGTQASIGWTTAKVDTRDGTLQWVVLPASTKGSVTALSGDTVFGEVSIKAIKEGKSLLDLNSNQTRIVAVDPGQTPSVYNSVSTTQTATLTVSKTAPTAVPQPPEPVAESKDTPGELQKFQSVKELVGYTAAELIVTTDQSSMVTVLFGPNPQTLLNSVVSTNLQTVSALRLSELEPNSRYYYRFRAESGNGDVNLSRIRSFQTSLIRSGSPVKAASLAVAPNPAQKNTVLYFVTTNADGALLTDTSPTVVVEKGAATVGEVAVSGGIYQVAVSSKLTSKQDVSLAVSAGGQKLGREVVQFDPNFSSPVAAVAEVQGSLPLTQTNLIILMVLAGMLLLLGILFYRLAKAK